jgi:hypothetical protein
MFVQKPDFCLIGQYLIFASLSVDIQRVCVDGQRQAGKGSGDRIKPISAGIHLFKGQITEECFGLRHALVYFPSFHNR